MKHVLFALTLLLFPVSLIGQATEGTILGTVVDPSGNVLVGAQITVTNAQTNFPRKTVTNNSGEYVVSSLPIGTYRVTSEVSGFRTDIKNSIELTVKARVRVDFFMQTGVVNQSVEVSSSAPLLKTDTSEVSTLISRKELESLPSLDRNFLSLQVLTPGTLRRWPNAGGDRIGSGPADRYAR